MISADVAWALLTTALVAAGPILLAALGEFVVEKSGALNVGIEGMMLTGAFAAYAVERLGCSPGVTLLVVAVVGIVAGLAFALLTVHLRCEPVVTGLMTNLLVLGATAVGFDALLRALERDGGIALSSGVRGVDPAVLAAVTIAMLAGLALVMPRTRAWLELRACGHDALAARAAGVRVVRVQTIALAFGGLAAALAGAELVYSGPGTFVEGMTAGRGFLALAAVVCARGRLAWIVAFAVVFGALTAFQFRAQSTGAWSHHALLALPYAVTLAALAMAPRRAVRV